MASKNSQKLQKLSKRILENMKTSKPATDTSLLPSECDSHRAPLGGRGVPQVLQKVRMDEPGGLRSGPPAEGSPKVVP